MIEIKVKVEIRSTEDENKVKQALDNIFEYENLKKIKENDKVYFLASSKSLFSLNKIANLIKKARTELTVRSILLKSTKGNLIKFSLNKQAAYMNKISFCTVESESPLSSINFEIVSNKINEIIDYISPLPKKKFK